MDKANYVHYGTPSLPVPLSLCLVSAASPALALALALALVLLAAVFAPHSGTWTYNCMCVVKTS